MKEEFSVLFGEFFFFLRQIKPLQIKVVEFLSVFIRETAKS